MTTDTRFPLFTEEGSADTVNARIGPVCNPRLRAVMMSIVKHLHAAVKEIEPSHEEWMAAIEFLTATGHKCDDWRQEFILLSDVLGVSMLVETISHRRSCGETESTVLGPFYVEGAPDYPPGADLRLDGKGAPLLVNGLVRDVEGNPIPDALLDVWQTNDDGFYDVQQPDILPQWNLRGRFRSGEDGSYHFITARPRHYPIPDDGPVGKLLGQLGRHPNRPAHIHFKVTAPGFDPVVTHIFDPACEWVASDAVFGVKQSLIAEIEPCTDGRAQWLCAWDFVLSRARNKSGATL